MTDCPHEHEPDTGLQTFKDIIMRNTHGRRLFRGIQFVTETTHAGAAGAAGAGILKKLFRSESSRLT